jgi:ribose 5-phosphate isomerase A
MSIDNMKKIAAKASLDYINQYDIVGVGTGSTVNHLINFLPSVKNKIDGFVASSSETKKLLQPLGIPILEVNSVNEINVYIDGADEINENFQMIKGGGGALTSEKILSYMSKNFICIADENKYVKSLGNFPLPIEVLPFARSFVARECVKLGGSPELRVGFISDHGNEILDVRNLNFENPVYLEEVLNNIPGVVTNGVFAKRRADVILLGSNNNNLYIYKR